MLEWPRLSEPADEPLDGSELVNATDSNGPSHAVYQHLVTLHFRTRPVGVPVLVVILRLLPDRAVCHLDERLALPTFPRPTDCVPHGRSMAVSTDRTGGAGFVRQSRELRRMTERCGLRTPAECGPATYSAHAWLCG